MESGNPSHKQVWNSRLSCLHARFAAAAAAPAAVVLLRPAGGAAVAWFGERRAVSGLHRSAARATSTFGRGLGSIELAAMSQSEQTGGTASESVQQSAPTKVVINSDDIAWGHCYCPDPKKKYSIVCNYCKKMINAGITRVKYHLARLGGHNVSKCDKVPTDVKQEMLALVAKKTSEKEQKQKEKKRARDVIDLDHSDGEMCTEDSIGTRLSC